MFEARNSVADRLLNMFALDRRRSRMLAVGVHGVLQDEHDEAGSGKDDMTANVLMSVAAITASITGLFKLTSHSGPDGKEMPSAADKGTDWVKDQFKGDDKKKEEKSAVGTSVGPSPLANPDDVESNRVRTAKADDGTQDAIRQAAEQQVVDYALLYAVAGAESSFRSDAGASTSSAVGLFQFTDSTWKYLCSQYKLDYTSEDRKDPRKSAKVAGLFVRSINETLQRNMGRKPSYGEVYMGYFLGPTGAVRFLKAAEKNPDAIGADLFPKAAKANPNVFYNKGDQSQPLTLKQILAKQEGKIISYAKDANPSADVAQSPISATPVQVALANPDAKRSSPGSSASGTSGPDPAAGYRTRTDSANKQVVGVPQPISQVASNYETAPTPIETKDQPQPSGTQIPAMSGSEQKPQQTIVRGRDGRVYTLNS